MFFKKKKNMTDNTFDKEGFTNNNADNLSPEAEEALASQLNVDDSVGGMQHLDDELNDDVQQKLETELADAKDKYMRLVAEFDNFRKRNAKERVELSLTAGKDIISSLLDVLDDSERAQKQLESGS